MMECLLQQLLTDDLRNLWKTSFNIPLHLKLLRKNLFNMQNLLIDNGELKQPSIVGKANLL